LIYEDELNALIDCAETCSIGTSQEISEALSYIIEMLKKIKIIKATAQTCSLSDFKCFKKKAKNYKEGKKHLHHLSTFGIFCVNPSIIFQ